MLPLLLLLLPLPLLLLLRLLLVLLLLLLLLLQLLLLRSTPNLLPSDRYNAENPAFTKNSKACLIAGFGHTIEFQKYARIPFEHYLCPNGIQAYS